MTAEQSFYRRYIQTIALSARFAPHFPFSRVMKLPLFLLSLSLLSTTFAAELYVDNVSGSDSNPGTREQPFQTFQKSLSVLKGGDTLHLVPNEEPYRERFGELGKQHSGTPEKPTIVDGHGAHLTRLNHFPADRWQSEGGDVFSTRLKHNVVVMSGKGYYDGFPFVFVDGQPLPCVKSRDALTANSCFFFLYYDPQLKALHPDHGKLTIQLPPGKTPADVKIMIPEADGVIVGGDHMIVRNINSSWSSSDLFDTHRGKGIIFEDITATDCLDQNTSAHSTADCLIRYSFFRNALAMCALDITFQPNEDCRITYDACIFERGGAGFQGSGHYLVENSIIRDNTRDALKARQNATLTVRNCVLIKGDLGNYGVSASDHASITLENCTLIGFDHAINLLGPDARITLKNCVILDSKSAYSLWQGAKPDQITSQSTTFSAAPTFTIDKQSLQGLTAYRAAFPGTEPTSRELSPGESPTTGSLISPTLSLAELKQLTLSSKP